jgi:hypothetical protein
VAPPLLGSLPAWTLPLVSFALPSLSWVRSFCGVLQGFIIIYIDSKKNKNSLYKAQWNKRLFKIHNAHSI